MVPLALSQLVASSELAQLSAADSKHQLLLIQAFAYSVLQVEDLSFTSGPFRPCVHSRHLQTLQAHNPDLLFSPHETWKVYLRIRAQCVPGPLGLGSQPIKSRTWLVRAFMH